MLGLQSRPAKTVIIWLLSLLAAIVCFGFLHSSGAVTNEYVELGGAFAGFVVSLVVLNNIWGRESTPEEQDAKVGRGFTNDKVVKALDLRHASPNLPAQSAPLTDYYRAKRFGDSESIEMHYATTSAEIEFAGSSTHPDATWRPVKVSHSSPVRKALKKEYVLNIPFGDVAKGEVIPIINNLVYWGAFRGTDGEWLETHLEYPTGRLVMTILCPDDMRVISAEGRNSFARGDLEDTPTQPTVLRDGSVVYWSIESPAIGGRYALSWGWKARAAN